MRVETVVASEPRPDPKAVLELLTAALARALATRSVSSVYDAMDVPTESRP